LAAWTADALANARPLVPPINEAAYFASLASEATSATERSQGGLGHNGDGVTHAHLSSVLVDLSLQKRSIEEAEGTEEYSPTSTPFTSTRVFPASACKVFPYRAVGKLFFSRNGNNYVCSGSQIKRGIVLTAGHCVHSGNGAASGWASNFIFAPAYDSGVSPYGNWGWVSAYTTLTWYSGGGGVPNAADYGMVIQAPQSGSFPGTSTGWLGWRTLSLINEHLSPVGYPCNFDSCNRQHRIDAQTQAASSNTGIMGSDMQGGSSGGPWVRNLCQVSVGQSSTPFPNQAVGVTSYGPINTSLKYQGASVFDSRFINMLNSACSSFPTQCS